MKMKKRLLGILLSLALILGLVPGMSLTAYAATETYTKLMNEKTVVKFNNYDWYIIADNSTAVDAGTVTLLAADTSFGKSKFHDSSKAYSTSTVKGVLDALTAEGGAFAAVKDAIADTDLTDVGVSGAKLYLLSKSEAGPYANFYFTGADGDFGGWWLRSPANRDDWHAVIVDGEDGRVIEMGYDVKKELGVRPALKLNLSSVIFTSNTFTLRPYDVTITAGSNMTKTDDSGAASQTGLNGAMTAVVYTANDGYYFPEDYSVDAVNGISVTRDSYTQITVAGTPTADAEITLIAATEKTTPDAPTTAAAVNCTTTDNNDGKLTGVTTEMEYKESNAASWTDGTGSDITGLVPGTYYVRIKATDTTLASANQELTIAQYVAPTYTVTWKNWDGTVLRVDGVAEGETPAYNGEDPVKPGNAQFDYIFTGWNPEVTAVAGDAEYTATFDETVHQHTFETEDPRWSWSFVDGKCYANATRTCTCGEVEEVQATVDNGTVNNDNATITYTATDKYGKTDSREFFLTYVVKYNGTSKNYKYGDICKLTADSLSDWKVNGILRAEGAKTFYFPVTVDAEVTLEASASEEQKGIINVLSMDNTTNSLTYVVSWSLPEGAQVKSTMIYRCKDDSHEITTAEALLAAPNLRSYNMKLNARNGQFTYKATKLTSGSHQTIMAQVVYTLNGETYTINTAEPGGTQSIGIGYLVG